MVTLFDPTDPKNAKGIQEHIQKLSHRTARKIEALHYLKIGADYICLDVSVTAASEEELDKQVLLKLASLHPMEILPAAPLELWNRALESKILKHRKMFNRVSKHHWLIVSLCEAA